jgi:hypothetical protein
MDVDATGKHQQSLGIVRWNVFTNLKAAADPLDHAVFCKDIRLKVVYGCGNETIADYD